MASSGRPLGSMIIELDMTSTKFEDSLKSIQNQFRLAKSEMKANLSVLDTTGTSYEKASSKVEELSKLMEVNEKQISALKDRYDTAVKVNGEYSDSAMKVANQLNKAEAQQAQYQRQLDTAKVAMKDAERGTDSYREALARVQKQTKVEVDSLQTQGKQTEANVVKYQALSKEINNYDKIISGEKAKLNDLIKTKGEDSKETLDQKEKTAELISIQDKAKAQYDELSKKVKNLTNTQAESIDKMNRLSNKMKDTGSSIKNIGSSMTLGFTTPVVAGFIASSKAANDYQYELQDVRKEVEAQGYSTSQVDKIMGELSKDVLNWSQKFGVGTKEVNDGLFELVSNGYNVKQAMGLMPSLLKTMIANSDKTGLSIKLTSSMLEQFGLNLGSNKSVIANGNQLMNEMTEATHKSAMSLGDLQEISGNAGAAMHAMGVSTNDFMAVAGRLKSAGIDASSVGTGLSSMMTRVGTGTGQAAADLKKYNIQVFDSSGKMKPMLDIIGQMQKAYKGMSGEEQQKFMYDVVGQENMKVGMTLMDANLGRYQSLSNEIKNSTGTVDKYNGTMQKTNDFAGKQFKTTIQDMSIAFGQKLLPSLTPVIRQLTNLMNSFSKLSSGTRTFITDAVMVTAVVGPILIIIGQTVVAISGVIKAIQGIKIAITAIRNFMADGSIITDLLTGPIGIAILAITALVAGFMLAYNKIKPFRDAVNNLGKTLKETFENVMKWFGQLPGKFKSAFSGMTNWGSQLVSGLKKSWSNVTSVTLKWVDDFKKVGKKMLDALVGALKGFGKLAVYALALPVGLAVLITKPLVEPMKNIMKTLINSIKAIWTPFSAWFKNLWTGISNTWHVTMTAISNWFKSIMSSISNTWRSSWTSISNFFRPILSSIGNFFRSIFNGIRSFFIGIMNAISNIATSAMNGISNAWNISLTAISNFFKNIFNGIKGFISPIMSSISNSISSALSAISSTWSKMWQGMADFFGGIWSGIKSAAADGINAVIGVINSGVDAIDSVWKFFTGKKTSVPHLGKVHFEQGGVVEQHLSVINDGKGANWKELVQLPDGELMMSHQRNWTGMLPAGTRIYNGDETKGIMNAVGIQKYAKGGIVGSIENAGSGLIDWAKGSLENVGSWIGDKFEALSKFMEHPIENTQALMTQAGNKVMPTISTYADFAKGALDKTAGKAGDWVKDHIQDVMDKMMESMGGSGGAMPAKAYGPMIRAAAAFMHQSITDFNVDMIERIIGNESGGNPRAINLTDSNAQAGHPSKGILQYIDQTFGYYMVRPYTDIWNPLHQLIALFNDSTWRSDMGMGYNGKYGEWRGNASGPSGPKLMALGGLVTQATNAIVGEAGPEIVLPLTNQTRAMQILSEAQARFGNGAVATTGGTDTTVLEQNQKQQSLLMEIQNKLLSKILEIISNGDGGNDDQGALNTIYRTMEQLGLKDRKITKYQMG